MYYITILDMFRAILCSSSVGLNCVVTASGIVTLCKRPYKTRNLSKSNAFSEIGQHWIKNNFHSLSYPQARQLYPPGHPVPDWLLRVMTKQTVCIMYNDVSLQRVKKGFDQTADLTFRHRASYI
jgi:hypothetical protein